MDIKKMLGLIGCAAMVLIMIAFAAVWIGFHRGEEGGYEQGAVGLCTDVPVPYKTIFETAGNKWKVQPAFIAAIFVGEHRSIADSNYKKWPDADQQNWDSSQAGAQGPFQFMPATWESHKQDGNGDGKMDIQNLWDSAFAAAHLLADNGAGGNTTDVDKLRNAAGQYNGGHNWEGKKESTDYVARVIPAFNNFFCVSLAQGECAQNVVRLALSAVGDPTSKYYSSNPRRACAAFVSTILKQAGALNKIIYTAQDLWDTTDGQIIIPKDGNLDLSVLQPGDIIYFKNTYDNGRDFSHVGIYIGNDHVINTSSDQQKVSNDFLTRDWRKYFAGAKRLCK